MHCYNHRRLKLISTGKNEITAKDGLVYAARKRKYSQDLLRRKIILCFEKMALKRYLV